MFLRVKKKDDRRYYYLCETYREKDKVKQKSIYIGPDHLVHQVLLQIAYEQAQQDPAKKKLALRILRAQKEISKQKTESISGGNAGCAARAAAGAGSAGYPRRHYKARK